MRMKLWTTPQYYMGASWSDYYVFLGQHRDSDKVTRSNFRVAMAEVTRIQHEYPNWKANPDVDNEPEMVVNPRESHWAVGHVEWIGIHKNAPQELIEACESMLARIDDYPLLDESDHSDLEWSEANDYWKSLPVKWRLRDYIQPAGLSCFAARHSLSQIMNEYDAGSLWEHLTSD